MWEDYRTHVLKFLAPLKRKLSVFVDASNGMAGKLVPRVFDGVENLEIIPLNFEITGEFAHEPNPLKAENMRWTQDGVREHGAALGACFDGDADRCMLVDDEGGIIGCDHLTALLAEHFAAIDAATPRPVDAPTTIVYDLRSSKVVPEMITALGARPQRSRVGHVFMKAKLRETKAIFGGELSGHFYFRDNHFADSGAIALASVLSVLGSREESLSQLVNPLRKYPQSGEINFRVEDKQAVMEGLKQTYSDAEEIDELDGITIDCFESRGWWFNVRPSNTEPLLRFNAEAKDETTLNRLIEEITPQLGEPEEDH
jgi:phosphomannomutase